MANLKFFRRSKKLTQKEMAAKLGFTLSMYEKVEGGRAGASSRFMERLKEAFPDANIDAIFFEKDSKDVADSSA